MIEESDASTLVAFGREGEMRMSDLRRDVALLAEALPAPEDGSHILLVFRHDRYLFLASLLASWHRGHAVALPPNTRRDAIMELYARPGVVGLLHDLESSLAHRVPDLLGAAEERDAERPVAAPALWPDGATLATVFTSGTSDGVNSACPKTATQLIGETLALQASFVEAPGQRFVATVQPGHIYGLLYSVLLPWTSGGAFLRETPFYPDAVAHAVQTYAADVLVTVPAHVRTLVAAPIERFASLRRVFSSTAPLDADVAVRFLAQTGVPITEVLGSSETGGIAHRQQPDAPSWTPLVGVQVRADDHSRLWVRSSYASPDGQDDVQTADVIDILPDGTFDHVGRADGVIKVGGHRVSLPAMERWIRQQDGIDDVALCAVDVGGARGKAILAAVVSSTSSSETLARAMRERFEEACLPRRFEFVDAIPREDNGKVARVRLLRLFQLNANGEPFVWSLVWSDERRAMDGEDTVLDATIDVPRHFGWFDGHFQGYAVMAAAVQLRDIVRVGLEKCLGQRVAIRRVTKMKFTGRIQPSDRLRLTVRCGPGEMGAVFRIFKGDELCSTGTVEYSAATEA